MRHVSVFKQRGTYAGWPANHGAWQWGDEFLVGFLIGKYGRGHMHNVVGHLTKVLARSKDGGESWQLEEPDVNFEASKIHPVTPAFDLKNTIIRVCGGYDHGGEYCVKAGGFYKSHNRGKTWSGAYGFPGYDHKNQHKFTGRTRVLDNMVFVSCAINNHWGSDWIFILEHDGETFKKKSVVCYDDYRAVMPAVARLSDRIVVTARRRGSNRHGGWIDAFVSDDDGATWKLTNEVGLTGQDNGNPPALIEANGKLYCAYGNRTEQQIVVSVSTDGGENWIGDRILRQGHESDIGYPQLFKRSDGQLVCVYYWAEDEEDHQHIEATIFKP